jgi:hypothetical protein
LPWYVDNLLAFHSFKANFGSLSKLLVVSPDRKAVLPSSRVLAISGELLLAYSLFLVSYKDFLRSRYIAVHLVHIYIIFFYLFKLILMVLSDLHFSLLLILRCSSSYFSANFGFVHS